MSEDHAKFLAQYLLSQLLAMGMVKKEIINSTSINFLADHIGAYLRSQRLDIVGVIPPVPVADAKKVG